MRVIIPVLALDYGGGERIIAEIANGLTHAGHEVILVVPYGGRIAWPIRASVAWVPALTADHIPSGDIILPNFYPTVLPAFQSRKGRCVRLSLAYEPLWVGSHEASASYDLPMPIIVISEWQRRLVQNRTSNKIFLLHPGVDHAAFHPYPKPNDGGKRILFHVRPHGYSWKGQADFAAAHGMLLALYPGLQVITVRSGRSQVDQPYPLPCSWRTAADDTAMGRIYAEADIFVYPSYFESFGLPPLEAMACGTAVVVGDCGGIKEYARHLENCLLVEPGNPGALASTVAALLGDSATRQRLIGGGLHTAAAWTWQRTYHEIEVILYEVFRS